MLDRVNLGITTGQSACQPRIRHRRGGHRNIDRLRQVHTPEDDAGVRLRRTQRDLDTLATVQADANRTGQGFKRSLF
jgi:hypothetical protein